MAGNIKNHLPRAGGAYYQGYFRPCNPAKYLGDLQKIIFRSSWELKFMNFCDKNDRILQWSSEGISIQYFNPLSKTMNNYYIDFFVILKNMKDQEERWLMEVKPVKYTEPPKRPKTMTNSQLQSYVYSAKQYIVNRAKFEAAKDFVADNDMKFGIVTEHFLFQGI